ncbi:hypothetical protein LINGRAHAP2_LOCUS31236 [Linum grandiflorum]
MTNSSPNVIKGKPNLSSDAHPTRWNNNQCPGRRICGRIRSISFFHRPGKTLQAVEVGGGDKEVVKHFLTKWILSRRSCRVVLQQQRWTLLHF